jgi:sarcosine oxidase subunit beta
MKSYDSIVIGGGILGCATAYELAQLGQKVLIIDKEYFGSGSTGRCIGGIRQQFSTPGSIVLAMESVRIFQQMQDVEWYPGGYLFLAQSEAQAEDYKRVMNIQLEMGLPVKYLEQHDVLEIVPMLDKRRFVGATYCDQDGQASPFLVIKGYMDRIRDLGGDILSYTEVVEIDAEQQNRMSLTTESLGERGKATRNEYAATVVVNAAGPWLSAVNELVQSSDKLPVESERHEALITETTGPLFDPMIVSYSPNCYFQQFHFTGQIIGCYTPEKRIEGIQNGCSYEFAGTFSNRVLEVVPELGNLKVVRSWPGWYTMTPDGSPIIGETNVKGFWVIGGASGHGFMLGPALGRSLAELICRGESSIGVDEFSLGRDFGSREKFG